MITQVQVIAVALLAGAQAVAAPVSDKRDWTETFDVGEAPTLFIDTIWGDVHVRAGDDDRITMVIHSERRADDQLNFERSLEILHLAVGQDDDGVFLRVGSGDKVWRDWPRCDGCELRVDVDVTVPRGSTVNVETITDGAVVVSDIAGPVTVKNSNGSVRASGLMRCERIESLNGDINVAFVRSPDGDCAIETLNGNIALDLAPGAETSLALALSNGKVISALDLVPFVIPPTVAYAREGGRHEYTVEQYAGLRLGRGGHTLTLKSLNGDVRVARSQ